MVQIVTENNNSISTELCSNLILVCYFSVFGIGKDLGEEAHPHLQPFHHQNQKLKDL